MKLPGDFYAKYWQKAPYFGVGATALAALTPSVTQLWQWAQQSEHARLIQPQQNYQVTLDPVAPPDDQHTLLVGHIEQHDPRWDDWARTLASIGRWSFSDLMISHALEGASVGAHRDQYDVFLIQLAGRRQWQVGSVQDRTLPEVDHGGSKLLPDFVSQQQWIATPGDVLYVPPGCGHHGVALDDDCMTLSVGFRQPQLAEVLERALEWLPDARVEDVRDQAPGTTVGDVSALRSQLVQSIQSLDNEVLSAAWSLACTQTAEADSDASTDQVRFASGVRAASISQDQAAVMGELFQLSPGTLAALCNRGLDLSSLPATEQDTLEEFREAGWLTDI